MAIGSCFIEAITSTELLERRVSIATRYSSLLSTHGEDRLRNRENDKAECRLHVCYGGVASRRLCQHRSNRGGVRRRVLRHERRQPAAGEQRDQHVQGQRHLADADLRAGPGGAPGRGRHGHPRGGRRAQRGAVQPRRQPGRGRVLGPQQHRGLPQGLLPLHLRGQRGGGGRGAEPGAGHGERPRRAGCGGAGRHQGHHVRVAGHPRRVQAALRRRVHRRGAGVHGPRPRLPGAHGGASHGQRLPLLHLRHQPVRHGPQLRALHRARHRPQGRRIRVPEPLRRHRRLLLRGDGQPRRLRRDPRGVRERVAVRRRRRGVARECGALQPEPDQPRRQGNAAAPGRYRDDPLLHVQREPQGERRGAELGALLPQHATCLPHQLQLRSA